MSYFMITASQTADGHPVYRSESGAWYPDIKHGAMTEDPEIRDQWLRTAQSQENSVCDPYAIELHPADSGEFQPLKFKERIRAAGPTIEILNREPSSPARSSGLVQGTA